MGLCVKPGGLNSLAWDLQALNHGLKVWPHTLHWPPLLAQPFPFHLAHSLTQLEDSEPCSCSPTITRYLRLASPSNKLYCRYSSLSLGKALRWFQSGRLPDSQL